MPDYDLLVIGSGPAGEKGAAQAAYFGKRVALVEKEALLGGAATNTGTLPSKTLRETALYLSGFRQRGLHAVDLALKRRADVRDLMFRERLVTAAERGRISRNLDRHAVDLLAGSARLVDEHTVAVSSGSGPERRVTASVILIATGSRPIRPSAFPFEDPRVRDSDTILEIDAIPESLAVVGGGVIGSEYACMFAALGVEVTLIERNDRLLGFLDGEIAGVLTRRMEQIGVRMRMPDQVASTAAGPGALVLALGSGTTLSAEMVLVAAGRAGNTGGLDLERIGVVVDGRGLIQVDEHYRTAVPSIYAAGDVIGFPALASTSMEQARIAMVHAFDLKYKQALPPILPYGIYTIPELSAAGETEESLRQKGVDYVAGRAAYADNARGQIIGDGGGMLKLLFRRDDMRLVGVHVVGEAASELVHIGLTAMLAGATSDLFIQTCFNYPTLSETYKYATYDALGRRARGDGA
jgi:NAD(P) transhydrogenase